MHQDILYNVGNAISVTVAAAGLTAACTLQVPGAGEQRPAQRGASSLSYQRPAGPHRGVPLQPGWWPVAQGVRGRQRLSCHTTCWLQQVRSRHAGTLPVFHIKVCFTGFNLKFCTCDRSLIKPYETPRGAVWVLIEHFERPVGLKSMIWSFENRERNVGACSLEEMRLPDICGCSSSLFEAEAWNTLDAWLSCCGESHLCVHTGRCCCCSSVCYIEFVGYWNVGFLCIVN